MNNPTFADQASHADTSTPPITAEQYAIAHHARTLARIIDHSHHHHDKIARLERLVDALLERVAQLEAER